MQLNRDKQVKDFKREFIVQAAENLLKEIGLAKLTMDLVAEKASYTKRTVYRYFMSKEDILLEIYIRHSLQKWAFQKIEMQNAEPGIARLKALGSSYFSYFKQNPHFLQLAVYFDMTGFDFSVERSESLKDLYMQLYEIDQEAKHYVLNEIETAKMNLDIRSEYTSDYIKSYLYYSIRAISNQLINPPPNRICYQEEKFFWDFLEIFIKGLK
ncbi:MAG TPA: TetR/AcrR family transcriptional regulator [Candidatus Cloacimonadota bacterium]|nr:TetR/AcrR family transcriptional regulator [Candidatus Cloacimonadota bacterium]